MFSVSYVGRVVANAETRDINGKTVVNFRTACNVRRGKEESVVWANVSFWGGTGIVPYLTKGKEVFVTGSFSTREYESNGEKRISLEVRADNLQLVGGQKDSTNDHAKTHASNTAETAPNDSEIPF